MKRLSVSNHTIEPQRDTNASNRAPIRLNCRNHSASIASGRTPSTYHKVATIQFKDEECKQRSFIDLLVSRSLPWWVVTRLRSCSPSASTWPHHKAMGHLASNQVVGSLAGLEYVICDPFDHFLSGSRACNIRLVGLQDALVQCHQSVSDAILLVIEVHLEVVPNLVSSAMIKGSLVGTQRKVALGICVYVTHEMW